MTAVIADHPAPYLLDAYVLGTLAPDRAAEIDEHLATCDSCLDRLVDVPEDSFVALLRSTQSVEFPDNESEPIERTVLLREAVRQAESQISLENVTSVRRVDATAEERVPSELLQHSRYRILGQCGAGGMGVVYRAEHRLMGREVALKVIRPELLRREEAVERFRREVHAAAALSHPNIVSAYDAEQSAGLHFLVMEYVPGNDLARLVAQRGPLPVRDACEFIRQAALGLAHAQERGMVHRDIKPQNLMLTPDGRIKILDFGLSKFVSESERESIASAETSVGNASLTSADASLGTPDYVAPEQTADARNADIRADIYGLGGTLYFLLAGRPPFPGSSVALKLRGHAEEIPRSLAEFRDDVPAKLAEVIGRMMAKRPEDRFQSPAEVADALRSFVIDATMEESVRVNVPPEPPALLVSRQSSNGDARKKVESPANGILAVTVLNLVLGVWSLATMPHTYPREDLWSIWGAVGGISMIPATLIMMQGALRMRRLESFEWAKAAAIYAVIPWTPMWFLGLPFGAWALWTLSDPAVREGFGREALPPNVRRRGMICTILFLFFPLAVGAGGVVYIETDEGEIAIEAHDPNARIRVLRDGKLVEVLDPVTKESIRVDTGVYTVQLGTSGFTTSIPEGEEFLIHRGNRKIVRVRRMEREEPSPVNQETVLETVEVPLIVSFSADKAPLDTLGVERDEEEGAWKIEGLTGRTVRLYEAPLPGEEGRGIDNRLLIYRAKMRTQDVTERAYLEMWVQSENGLKYFSRGFDDAVSGTTADWVDVQTPFWLKKGERITRAQLNLVVEGKGTVWVKEIRLEARPRPKTAAENLGEWLKEQILDDRSTGGSAEELDKLVAIEEENVDRMRAGFEIGSSSRLELIHAEIALLEAKVERATIEGREHEVNAWLQKIVELTDEQLAQTRIRFEAGVFSFADVQNAERELSRAKIRLFAVRNDRSALLQELRQLVDSAEAVLAMQEERVKIGVESPEAVTAAQKAVLDAKSRLKTVEDQLGSVPGNDAPESGTNIDQ